MLIRQTPNIKQDYIFVPHEIGVKLQMQNIMPTFMDIKGFYFDKKYQEVIRAVNM